MKVEDESMERNQQYIIEKQTEKQTNKRTDKQTNKWINGR